MVTALERPVQHIGKFWLIANEPQERRAVSAICADAQYVFGGRVKGRNQQCAVEKDDGRAQAINYCVCIARAEATAAAVAPVFCASVDFV